MPGRAITQRSTTSRPSHKSSSQNIQPRKSNAARISSPTIDIPDEGPSSVLRTRVCSVFDDSQKTTAAHRKLVVRLRRIQEACCPAASSDQNQGEFEEDDFNVEIARCVIRLMGVKKSEGVGDRIVRFLGLFLRHATEKGKKYFTVNPLP
jgi:condensin complex subunit 3